MNQKYILEKMLLLQIFDRKNKEIFTKHFSISERKKLPLELEFTPDFIETYLNILKKVIPQKLTEIFQWREFFFHKNDTTHRCRLIDNVFWEKIPFHFTQKGINFLWQSCITKKTLLWKQVSPWDAILIKMYTNEKITYTPEWLIDKNAHWTVIAYFLLENEDFFNYQIFPYTFYFSQRDKTEYPIRFLLIELASNYYKKIVQILEKAIESAKDNSHYYVDIGNRTFWNWLQEMEKKLAIDLVKETFEYWCNDGMLGYDDDDFLKKQEQKTQLMKNIKVLQMTKKTLGEINE